MKGDVTEWLARWRAGQHQALDHIVPLVYGELRQVARRQLRHEASTPTLSATGLVHEVYLRLVQQRQIQAVDRDSFLATAGQTMRRIQAVAFRRKVLAADHPQLASAECDLARALAALGRDAEARDLLEACVPRIEHYGWVEPPLRAAAVRLRNRLR